METILITGLDGSGKSTILRELSKVKDNNAFEFIYLPIIDLQCLEADYELSKTAEFINLLNHMADEQKIPSLKAIAIFGSMLLYKKIYEIKSKTPAKVIFCERHPLIDTMVYAQFYAGKTGTIPSNSNLFSEIDRKYKNELEYLVQLIPNDCAIDKNSEISWFVGFIFKRFFIENKLSLTELQELFEITLPDKIYYLKADAEILFQRISDREIHEAHETIEVLEKLGLAYNILFTQINISYPELVEIVDASDIPNLDKFRMQISQKYSIEKNE